METGQGWSYMQAACKSNRLHTLAASILLVGVAAGMDGTLPDHGGSSGDTFLLTPPSTLPPCAAPLFLLMQVGTWQQSATELVISLAAAGAQARVVQGQLSASVLCWHWK